MVEVFRTDVTNDRQAKDIVAVIANRFAGYRVNFDLEDRDHILRVESPGNVDVGWLMCELKYLGVAAEVLSDEVEDIDFSLPDGRVII